MNYDCLRAIAFELNTGLQFQEAIKDMNILHINNTVYIATLYTKDGKKDGKILMYFAEKDSLRVFLLNMVLLLMMKLQEYEMADLEVQQRISRGVNAYEE